MGEKKGKTVKLVYPFNSAACLEIQLPNGKWYRVTPNEFRSFNSPRKISHVLYEGPVYLFGTNIIVDDPVAPGIQYANGVDPRKFVRRHGERV